MASVIVPLIALLSGALTVAVTIASELRQEESQVQEKALPQERASLSQAKASTQPGSREAASTGVPEAKADSKGHPSEEAGLMKPDWVKTTKIDFNNKDVVVVININGNDFELSWELATPPEWSLSVVGKAVKINHKAPYPTPGTVFKVIATGTSFSKEFEINAVPKGAGPKNDAKKAGAKKEGAKKEDRKKADTPVGDVSGGEDSSGIKDMLKVKNGGKGAASTTAPTDAAVPAVPAAAPAVTAAVATK